LTGKHVVNVKQKRWCLLNLEREKFEMFVEKLNRNAENAKV
jgi:predicted nucleotidyltransferase